ncbi:hypothetical protein [Cognatiyoonia sp. IB215182]|uniref:hypothetical protein n=1 Tax=Cognatiyoonia sp. IB215182 TaxID=3097353 RepID=UPI002A0F433D|nr:hypothetical protein [Cognatiyoonia sp. IB215182]MDX8355268.1 hypothetical protein [Cognatiyoonia sp. IB215182]
MGNTLRNLLLPPPAIIAGSLIMFVVVWTSIHQDENQAPGSIQLPFSADHDGTAEPIGLAHIEHDPETLAVIARQSLFLQGREPWQEVVPEQTVVAAPEPILEPALPEPVQQPLLPPEISLLGIVNTAENTKILILDQRSQSERWIAVGDLVGDWEVVEIRNNAIVLRAGGEETVVSYNR